MDVAEVEEDTCCSPVLDMDVATGRQMWSRLVEIGEDTCRGQVLDVQAVKGPRGKSCRRDPGKVFAV